MIWSRRNGSITASPSILPIPSHRRRKSCTAIRSSQITHSELSILREVRDLPVIMLPPAYTAAERYVCAHFSAMQYIRASGQHETTEYNDDNCLQYYLSIPAS